MRDRKRKKTHRGRSCDDGQKLEGCGHKPRDAWSHQELEEAGKNPSLEALEGVALQTL